MYKVLIILIVTATLQEFGITFSKAKTHPKDDCLKIRSVTKRILTIDWKPISIFPDHIKLISKKAIDK